MANLKIDAGYRSNLSKGYAKSIRNNGYVTGSIFGHNDEPISVELKLSDLVKQIKRSEQGMTSLIDIKIKDAPQKADGTVIIKNFFKDPLTKKVLDIQFQRVDMDKAINVSVPVIVVGEAAGVVEGGVLEQALDQIDIQCLPGDIPASIDVDISGLEIGSNIKISDITIPDNIEVITDIDTVVALCHSTYVAPEEEEEVVEGEEESTKETEEAAE